jgi:hypothetical protein
VVDRSNMSSWWSDHPDLDAVARRGRSELQADAAAAEHDTELLRRRRRHLIDVCFEWMSRGDLVTVALADRHFQGRLAAAVNDLIIVQTRTCQVAVNTDTVQYVRSDRRAEFDGTTGNRTVSSFRAGLGRHEVEQTPVHLIGRSPAIDIIGVIEASTEDHVLVRDLHGVEWALVRTEIACAIDDAGAASQKLAK